MSIKDSNVFIDPVLISKLRQKFADECRLHYDLYDQCDCDSVSENEWTVKRFLIFCHSDVDKAFVMLRDAMRWRKSYGVNARTDLDYPKEFYKIGAIFSYCKDRHDNVMVYMRIKLYKKIPKYSELIKEYFIHIANKVDIQTAGSGWSIVFDCREIGPSNFDLSMLRFVTSSIKQYFPCAITYVLNYGVPKIMTHFISLGLRILPDEAHSKIKFAANKQELLNYVCEDKIPDFLGGKCRVDYRRVPYGAMDGKDFAIERGYSLEDYETIRKYYEPYLNETKILQF